MTVKSPHGPAAWAEHLASAGDITPHGVQQTGPSNGFRVCRSEAEADAQKLARDAHLEQAGADRPFLQRLNDAEQSVSQCCHQGHRSRALEVKAETDMQNLVSHLHEKGHPAANPERDFAKHPVGEDEKWGWAGRQGRPMPDAERKVQDEQGRLEPFHHRGEVGLGERAAHRQRPPMPEECPVVKTHDAMRNPPNAEPQRTPEASLADRIHAKRREPGLTR